MYGLVKEIVDAYNVLASRRTVGMAPNPIQLTEILAYFELFGRPTVPHGTFIRLIELLDSHEMESGRRDST